MFKHQSKNHANHKALNITFINSSVDFFNNRQIELLQF